MISLYGVLPLLRLDAILGSPRCLRAIPIPAVGRLPAPPPRRVPCGSVRLVRGVVARAAGEAVGALVVAVFDAGPAPQARSHRPSLTPHPLEAPLTVPSLAAPGSASNSSRSLSRASGAARCRRCCMAGTPPLGIVDLGSLSRAWIDRRTMGFPYFPEGGPPDPQGLRVWMPSAGRESLGDLTFRLMGVGGAFTLPAGVPPRQCFCFAAAGSGFAPVMSILRCLAAEHPTARCASQGCMAQNDVAAWSNLFGCLKSPVRGRSTGV